MASVIMFCKICRVNIQLNYYVIASITGANV